MIQCLHQSGWNVKGQRVSAASSQIRFEDTIRSVPLYLITAYPCVLEHGQTTQAQLTGELNVGKNEDERIVIQSPSTTKAVFRLT